LTAFKFTIVTLKIDENCKTILPRSQSMYQTGVNTLWDIVRKTVPDPMYELFGQRDVDDQKCIITARQDPFKGSDWRKMPFYKLKNPGSLRSNIPDNSFGISMEKRKNHGHGTRVKVCRWLKIPMRLSWPCAISYTGV
jgi:hypothetical protein